MFLKIDLTKIIFIFGYKNIRKINLFCLKIYFLIKFEILKVSSCDKFLNPALPQFRQPNKACFFPESFPFEKMNKFYINFLRRLSRQG